MAGLLDPEEAAEPAPLEDRDDGTERGHDASRNPGRRYRHEQRSEHEDQQQERQPDDDQQIERQRIAELAPRCRSRPRWPR